MRVHDILEMAGGWRWEAEQAMAYVQILLSTDKQVWERLRPIAKQVENRYNSSIG